MYAAVNLDNIMLGDVVRRVGRPLEIGLVLGTDGELVKVRWYKDGPVDRRHYQVLQRRVEGMSHE